MSKIFIASASGELVGPGFRARCALGKGGAAPAEDKREGDGASPIGSWPMRRAFYRPDRVAPPQTGLPVAPLAPHDGWCDDPASPLYNRPVSLPFPASHEVMWRDDHVYDIVVELGHNDDPPRPGLGSAIFLHLAHDDYAATEGCIALAESDLRALLASCEEGAVLKITG